MRNCLLLLFFMWFFIGKSQERIYTQDEINEFEIAPTNVENLKKYEEMLLTNEKAYGWVYFYRKKAYYYVARSMHDSAVFYADKGLNKFQSLSSKVLTEEHQLKTLYLYKGRSLIRLRKYREAIEALQKAMDYSKKFPEIHTESNMHIVSNLGAANLGMGDKKEALRIRLEVSKDSAMMSDIMTEIYTYNRLGILYGMNGKKDSALYYYKKCLKTSLDNKMMNIAVGIYGNIGYHFKEKKQIDSMLYYFKKSYYNMEKHKEKYDPLVKISARSNYASVLFHDKKYEESLILSLAMLDSIKNMRNDQELMELRERLYENIIGCYKESKNIEKMYDFFEAKNKLYKDFHKEVLEEKVRDLNIAYESKEKEASIQKLEQKSQEQEALIRERTIITLALGGGLVLLLGIGVLFFRQRKLQTKYETANLEQRLLRSQLNPHFIFNALNTVSGLAHQKSEQTVPYIVKLGNLIRLVLKNSREEFVSVADEVRAVEDYLELQSNFSQKFQYQIAIQETIDTEEVLVPPMFVQPFVENAINHGIINKEDGKIHVNIVLDQKQKLLTCTIEDNGEGFKGKKEKQFIEKEASYSGDILKERLKIYAKSMHKKARYTVEEKKKAV